MSGNGGWKSALKPGNRFVLDTSALLTYVESEPGADEVTAVLEASKRGRVDVYVSFMTAMEGCYKVWQLQGDDVARQFYGRLLNLPIKLVDEVTQDLFWAATEAKAKLRLSVADAWILATAVVHGAYLVHKDPEFDQAKGLVELLPLPYK